MNDPKKFGEALKIIMKSGKVTQKQLAAMLGYRSQSGVAEMLNRPDTSTSTDKLIAVCKLLNYEVVLQPVRKGKRADDQIVLEMSNPDAPVSSTTRPRTIKTKEGDAE